MKKLEVLPGELSEDVPEREALRDLCSELFFQSPLDLENDKVMLLRKHGRDADSLSSFFLILPGTGYTNRHPASPLQNPL